ncbi:hypothetical protein [Pseudodonghicola flavimaris]|uniref:Glyceraldehyde-3-phosphate dehydrogenase n=1 Tax=Pseudodonghicola flavimaris TaxID=3050036 RepID=A0ABT7EVP1_9RHOB|nr:hypothetical protein [Pseudodonghicola flavimaris]MDK3016420.1 hypothetical protein [Pseudodonghicola flavimaris]
MTDKIALVLGLIIVAALVVDISVFGTVHLVFLAKKFADMLEWMAFWR